MASSVLVVFLLLLLGIVGLSTIRRIRSFLALTFCLGAGTLTGVDRFINGDLREYVRLARIGGRRRIRMLLCSNLESVRSVSIFFYRVNAGSNSSAFYVLTCCYGGHSIRMVGCFV